MKIKVALIQGDIILGNISANEEKYGSMVRKAAESGAEIIVLPELWNTGYDMKNIHSFAQKEKGSSTKLLKDLAVAYNVNIVGGSIPELREGDYYNMLPLINRKGVVTEKYRKVHLFPYVLEEEKYFTAGDKWGIGEIDDFTVGLMLCYDLRFPEFCRNIVLRGANIVFIPAQWPKERISHWQTLLRSRAIENQIFIVGVNRVGKDESSIYNGNSMIIDPYGNVVAAGGEGEEIIIADLDLLLIDEFRKKIPSLGDRKNILDEIDNNYL